MIARSKSFSKGGSIIDRYMSIEKYKVDSDNLQQMLRPRIKATISQQQQQPLNRFDLVTGREKLSPFLVHHTRDAHTHLDYQNKKETVMNRPAQLPIRREKDQRLSLLMTETKRQAQEQTVRFERQAKTCRKFHPSEGQQVSTAGQLQNGRKTCHHMDFGKQSDRPFDRTIQKMTIQREKELTRYNSTGDLSYKKKKDFLDKKNTIHSFGSYPKRQFLTEKKVRGVPQESGQDWYKVNPQKFKSNWKTVEPPKFEEMAQKKLSRYDRDSPHWFTQLSYNAKGKGRTVRSHIDFDTQTERKQNIVKSGYPMRLAI